MNTELASILEQQGRLAEWASNVRFNAVNLSAEDQDISGAIDAFLREGVGRTGADPYHEIAQLVRKAITQEVVEAPSAVVDYMFDQNTNIGEFDDVRFEVEPKNTIQVFNSIPGGNVNRSYVDFTALSPKWVSLQAETEIKLQDIRRNGYRSVATLVNYIRDAFEWQKIVSLMTAVDTSISSGNANYITESTAQPTAASADKLALYLMDVRDTDVDSLICFGRNAYIQAIGSLPGSQNYLTDAEKNFYNQNGLPRIYAGMNLYGFSGTKTLPNGAPLMPAKKVFGAAGKVGQVAMRGETQVLQETDINSEAIHIKVNGYTFGYAITHPEKVAKITLS